MPQRRVRVRKEAWETQYRKVSREDRQHEALAAQRMGKTPAELLRWVVTFAQEDLTSKRPEELVALGYDLRMLPHLVKEQVAGVTRIWQRTLGPMPEATLQVIHHYIAEGLRTLMGGRPWKLPGPFLVYRSSPEGSAKTQFSSGWGAARQEDEAILAAVVRLVLEHGGKLRACPVCRRIFVSTRRQRYCDTRCSQRVRNQRRKEAE